MKLSSPIPATAVGICLYRIVGDRMTSTEVVSFTNPASIEVVLRRATISGLVDVGGTLRNHFADLFDASGDMVETVALDHRSYGALKNRWMRCKLVSS